MIQILFEDEWILVCLKPAGVLSEGNTPDSLPVLLAGQGEKEIYPVHRLDRNTCGVMVFARRRDPARQVKKPPAKNTWRISTGCPPLPREKCGIFYTTTA